MKIISLDDKTSIENVLQKDILIPVRVYKIPIIQNEKQLNFLEKTITQLKQVDNSLTQKEIINLLGLEGKDDLVKFVLDKLDEDNLINKNENKEKVTIYWFYQELITGKLLPIITKVIDNFCYIQENNRTKIQKVESIKFEKNNKQRSAFGLYKNHHIYRLTQEDFIKSIIINNQTYSNSQYIQKISYRNITQFSIDDSEEFYLHTKLFIPKVNHNIILVADGFNNNFSTIFQNIIQNNFIDFVNYLKNQIKVDTEQVKVDISIPFESKIDNFFEVKNLVKQIEIDLQKYNQKDIDAKTKEYYKSNILKNLFDVIEKSLEILVKDLKNNKLIQKDKILHIQKEQGIELDGNIKLFNNLKNNLQGYLAKAIFYKKDEVRNISKKDLVFLDKLLDLRNDLKHSAPVDLDNIDIGKYVKIGYKLISSILKIKHIDIEKNDSIKEALEDEQELYFNAIIDIEKQFLSINDEIKDRLSQIKFYIDERKFDINIAKYIINDVYSLFEYIFKGYQKIDKEKVFEKYPNLPIELKTVKIKDSLGAYYLNYIYYMDNSKELTSFIAKIIKLRGHGNQISKDLTFKKDEVKSLVDQTFEFIKQIFKEK